MRFLKHGMMVGIGCAALTVGCQDPLEPGDPGAPTENPRNPESDPRQFGTPPVGAPEDGANDRGTGTTQRIEANLEAKSGSELSGTAILEQRPEGVMVTVEVDDLPAGTHAVHVHQMADCSAPDASSAGEHFNPENEAHGVPPSEPRHLGDLGNLEVKEDGGRLEILVPDATLDPTDPMSFANRAIIVHEKADTGAQPSGASGGRIGCAELRAGE